MLAIDVSKMARHQQYFEKHIEEVEEKFTSFQNKIENRQPVKIIDTRHKNKRALERSISIRNIMAVVEEGYIIETSRLEKNSFDILIMSYVKTDSKRFRPLHVSAVFHADTDTLIIKTVYDPRSKEEQWKDNYTKRVFYK